MPKPRGLFDEQFRLQILSKKRDPLEQLSSHIDFEFFRKPMRKFFDKNKLRQKDTDIHDSEVMDELLNKEEGSDQDLYADSASVARRLKWPVLKKGSTSCIHEKGYRGKPLTKRQQERNRKKSKTSARVEHLFACMSNSMNELYLCYRSFRRNATSHS
jgi:hypothetical protein